MRRTRTATLLVHSRSQTFDSVLLPVGRWGSQSTVESTDWLGLDRSVKEVNISKSCVWLEKLLISHVPETGHKSGGRGRARELKLKESRRCWTA